MEKLRSSTVPSTSTRLIRLDVKHFFMSGRTGDIAEQCVQLLPNVQRFDQVLRELATDVAHFLLHNQTIRSSFHPKRLWRVLLGSGMGLKYSSETASAALCSLAEVSFATDPDIQAAYGIHFYYRFVDDILISQTGRSLFTEWFRLYSNYCKWYKIEVVEIGQSVEMLAVEVSIIHSKYVAKPKLKVDSGPVLSVSSAHPPSVHKSWPAAVFRGIESLCTDRRDARRHQVLFIERLQRYGHPISIVKRLIEDLDSKVGSRKPTIRRQN